MQVKDVMSRVVITIGEEEQVGKAAWLMREHKVSGLPVLDHQENLVGMITESDIVQVTIPKILQEIGMVPKIPGLEKYSENLKALSKRKVQSLVNTKRLVSVTKETSLGEAIALMVAHNIKKLPVICDEKLCGILTYSNIISLMTELSGEENPIQEG